MAAPSPHSEGPLYTCVFLALWLVLLCMKEPVAAPWLDFFPAEAFLTITGGSTINEVGALDINACVN